VAIRSAEVMEMVAVQVTVEAITAHHPAERPIKCAALYFVGSDRDDSGVKRRRRQIYIYKENSIGIIYIKKI